MLIVCVMSRPLSASETCPLRPHTVALGKRKRNPKARGGRGNGRKKQKTVKEIATQVAMDVVQSMGGSEKKFLDTELTATALTAAWLPFNPTGTGCTDSLSVPSEGNGESQRDGRNYVIDSVMVRGVLSTVAAEAAANTQTDFRARVVLYWDLQTNSAEATAPLIFDAGGTSDILAFRNLQNSRRFIVLYDQTFLFNMGEAQMAQGGIDLFASPVMERPFEIYKKFNKGIKVQCDSTTANVTSCTDSNFGIAAITSSTSAQVTIQYQARVRFRG